MTLPGHKEAISSIVWTENNEIYSSSWDHTIKLWDAELGGLKSEVVGNKSFFSISRSELNHTIIAASADRHVRLYDTRSQGKFQVKQVKYKIKTLHFLRGINCKSHIHFSRWLGIKCVLVSNQ